MKSLIYHLLGIFCRQFIVITIILQVKNVFMVTYDVFSLFTNILLSETIDIAVKLILENKKELKFSENELTN